MTPQERDLLTRFLDDLAHAQPAAKDAEAAAQIDRALTGRDAGYVLVQHAIVSDAALHDARQQAEALQQRLDELQRQLPAAAPSSPDPAPSFLGSLFGRGRPSEAAPAQGGWGAPAMPASPYGGAYPQPGSGPFSGGGGLGSFLRTAGTTAAGVAGGAFLFEGLSDMFGGGEHRHDVFEGGGGGDRQGFADMGGGDRGGDAGGGDGGQFDVGGDYGSGGDYG